jgi:regulator of replication initiation timing
MIGRTAPLLAQIATLERQLADRKSMDAKMFASNVKLSSENADLRARLAVFTAPRQRDEKGRYLPTQSTIDQMIEALEAM